MTHRFLLTAFALAGAVVAQTPPSAPLTFDIRLPDTRLPLRLQDPLDLRHAQLSFSGNVAKVHEPATPITPPKSAVKPAPVGMPIVTPDPSVAHAMNLVAPKPGIDYKIVTVPEAPHAAVAAAAPEARR